MKKRPQDIKGIMGDILKARNSVNFNKNYNLAEKNLCEFDETVIPTKKSLHIPSEDGFNHRGFRSNSSRVMKAQNSKESWRMC